MTSPDSPTPPEPGSAPDPSPIVAARSSTDDEGSPLASPVTPTHDGRLGASTFTIEGRAAPALFVVGWLASLLGLGGVLIGILSGGGLSSTIVLGVSLVLLTVGFVAASGSQGLDRRARGILPYLGPSPILVFAAAVPVSIIAIVVVVIPMSLLGIPADGPLARTVSILLQTIVYVGLIRLLVVDTGALSWAEMGVRRLDRAAFAQMGSGALWAVPVIVVTIPIAAILQQLFTVTPESPLPPAGETSGFILNLVAGAILAPLGEELLFRGLATTAWVRGIGARRGIVRGALFFALVHILTVSGGTAGEAIQLAIIGFTTRVPVALALGWLFVRRGSIWASFGLHASFNAILLILAEAAIRST